MDSTKDGLVYNSETSLTGGSNARDIEKYVLSDLNVQIDTELAYAEWSRHEHVLQENPDRIIIHLSAFYDDTRVSDPDKKLRNFN